nr:site-2 protease family protein [Planctomycetota bacterium]
VQVRALAALRKQRGGARSVVPAAIEADAVLRQEEMVERRVPAGSWLWMFLLTMLAFIATAPLAIGSNIPVPLILAILLFHEFGHFLAMRACGYRDTRIFFLPLFGAAASGRKKDATIPQQVLVSLMGPLPGIVLGLALLAAVHADRGSPLFQAGLMLVAINLFNLLPVLPLDGGQILCRVLFARRPWLDLVFRALAAVAMVALGIATSPILIYLGIFLAIGLVHHRQIARLRSRIMRDPAIAGLAGEPLTEAVSAAVAQDAVTGRALFPQRLRMVRDITAALAQPCISTGTRVALLGAYVGAFLLAPAVLLIWRLVNH